MSWKEELREKSVRRPITSVLTTFGDSNGEVPYLIKLPDAISICKEAIKKAKVGENIRWINKIGKDGWCINDEKFVDRIKELESEK